MGQLQLNEMARKLQFLVEPRARYAAKAVGREENALCRAVADVAHMAR